ncbi:hypothetical protein [Nocardia sp. NPDC002869]|uniref:hypothetical protein n=1 Tax=Nocardia sp. NPDC002869 TaxID=3161032 RepID=UPI00398D625E
MLAEQWAAGPDREYSVHRRPAGDGADVITLRYGEQGQGGETSMQDGHAAIARLLGGLGERHETIDPGKMSPGASSPTGADRHGRAASAGEDAEGSGFRSHGAGSWNTSRAGSRVSAHSHYLFLVERYPPR